MTLTVIFKVKGRESKFSFKTHKNGKIRTTFHSKLQKWPNSKYFEFVNENELVWWMDVPFCIEEEERDVMAVSVEKVVASNIVYHSLLQTVRDTLAWDMGRPAGTELAAGLKAGREAELLKLWASRAK
jgi:hypothetical protein